ncbi:MAG: hypothetical protein IPG61_06475 [bacterium]|nr:hypothetical protein [bacterium]MBK7049014.1 hypothetical protein [bacterium]MBK9776455.1 hypothetical protein [bacterium]
MLLSVILMAVATFLLNLPMGYWRQGVRKFSWQWIVAIHAMVPVIILLRHLMHIGFAWWTFLITIPCYFGGQFVGARLRRRGQMKIAAAAPPKTA